MLVTALKLKTYNANPEVHQKDYFNVKMFNEQLIVSCRNKDLATTFRGFDDLREGRSLLNLCVRQVVHELLKSEVYYTPTIDRVDNK